MSKASWQEIVHSVTHINSANGLNVTAQEVGETLAKAFTAAGYKTRIDFKDGKYAIILDDGDARIVLDLTRKGNVFPLKRGAL
jgi:hypothetical protein